LRLFQTGFRSNLHLPEVSPVCLFAELQFVGNHTVKSCSHFFCDFSLMLNIISVQHSVLLQKCERFKGCIETTIERGQRIINFCLHRLTSMSHISDTAICIIRLMLSACPYEFRNASEDGFRRSAEKSTSHNSNWPKRRASIATTCQHWKTAITKYV